MASESHPTGHIVSNADDLLSLFDADYGILVIGEGAKILGPNEHGQEILIMAEYLRLKRFESVDFDCPVLLALIVCLAPFKSHKLLLMTSLTCDSQTDWKLLPDCFTSHFRLVAKTSLRSSVKDNPGKSIGPENRTERAKN
jgi:hypothetical protein